MSNLKTIAIADIRDWNPCYDPSRYIPEGWTGTALDILRLKKCPAEDRLWVVLREECIDTKELRLFAVRCAREVMRLMGRADPRSVAVCDVAERYARGKATRVELDAVRDASRSAVWAAAREAAAYAGAREAAYAADAAARAATYAACATYAAYAAVRDAAAYAAYAAARETAAWTAVWVAARDQQVEWLIEVLEGDDEKNNNTGGRR